MPAMTGAEVGPGALAVEPAVVGTSRSGQGRLVDRLAALPWWALVLLAGGAFMVLRITLDERYGAAFRALSQGIRTVVVATPTAFALALAVGMVVALGRLSSNGWLANAATLYVQVMRGVPMAVWVLYVAFVGTPLAVGLANWLGQQLAPLLGPDNVLAQLHIRDISETLRLVLALGLAYAAFEAETIRAGIEGLGRGQAEAARSLGLSHVQAMRHVILPQAFRRVLPTLGNDLVSICKDSSLGVLIAAPEITQEAKKYNATTFQVFATYNMAIFLYLCLTLLLSMGVKWLEGRIRQPGHGA
jgi:polar amino acid transport system permease protein